MLTNDEIKNEKAYLNETQDMLTSTVQILEKRITESEQGLDELSKFIALSFYEMDHEEAAVQRSMLEKLQLDCLDLKRNLYVLQRQQQSPYFGRIDFVADDDKLLLPLYIGIAHIASGQQSVPRVLDWRAPISSLYYDYELGRCSYLAPMGKIFGEINLKRQYKTQQRHLIYAFNSNLTIGDEILRQTLSSASDDKMKNIVSTIQTAQNKIIRANESQNMLIQGVAGSGKTSIALHRVAYLLYKNKISAKDILIVSPSALFSDYISDVLPELGEENTPKTTFEEIARSEFSGFLHFETRAQMLESLLQKNLYCEHLSSMANCLQAQKNYLDKNLNIQNLIKNNNKSSKNINNRLQEVEFKASFMFFELLQNFCSQHLKASFHAHDISVGNKIFKAEEIQNLYSIRYADKKPAIKIEWIADHIVDQLNVSRQNEKAIFLRVKKVLYTMFESTGIVSIYTNFLTSLGLEIKNSDFLFKGKEIYCFEDVPALLYIKDFLLGVETQKHFKHVIIDEMQDYSPVSLFVLNVIFPCSKTIMGDINQCLEKNLNNQYLKNLESFLNTTTTFLNTTYRSTLQIAQYSQSIINLKNVNNFNRNGCEVKHIKTNFFTSDIVSNNEPCFEQKSNFNLNFVMLLQNQIKSLSENYKKIAIIVSTSELANKLYEVLKEFKNIQLVDSSLGSVGGKINIIPVVFSKGLEFDAVVMFEESMCNNFLQRNIAYISATRALHELIIFTNHKN